MTELSTRAAAQLISTLHVIGARVREARTGGDRGQAAAEYVGMLVFVGILIAAVLLLAPGVSTTLKGIIDGALAKLAN